MPQSFQVDWRSSGVRSLGTDLKKAADNAKVLSGQLSHVNQVSQSLNRQSSRAAISGGATGPAARYAKAQANLFTALTSGASQNTVFDAEVAAARARKQVQQARDMLQGPKPAKALSGPFQALAKARQNLTDLQSSGAGKDALDDARLRVQQAQRSANQAQEQLAGGPALAKRLASVVSTSRFGTGGLMPLVGRSLAAIGLAGEAGGTAALILGGLAIAGTALKAFADSVTRTAATVQEFRLAAAVSGGTAGQIATLTSLGVPAGQIGGRAAALRAHIAGDPFAQMAASNLGTGFVLPRPFGGTNEAELFLKVIQGLRKITDDLPKGASEAERMAAAETQLTEVRKLQLEDQMALIKMSKAVNDQMLRDVDVRKKSFDPKTEQDAADLAGEMIRLQNAMENLGVEMGKPFIKPLADFTAGTADAANATAKEFRDVFSGEQGMRDAEAMQRQWNKGWNLSYPKLLRGPDGKPLKADMWGNPVKDPLDKNTDAVQKNTDEIKRQNDLKLPLTQPGTFGGRGRAQGALPPELQGWAFDNAVAGNGLRLGQWTFSG